MAITWKRWTCDLPEGTRDFGGLGGFFDRGMRWGDYLNRSFYAEDHPRMEELRAEILRLDLWCDGAWHQDDAGAGDTMPVWIDGAVFAGSQRAWGDLLAAIWSTELDGDFWYGDFAWDLPDRPKRAVRSTDLPACGSFHG